MRRGKRKAETLSTVTVEVESRDPNEQSKPEALQHSAAKDGGVSESKRVKISGLYKPPTHDELQTLKETESLYRTNLIKLQITELLAEVKPSKQSAELETFLFKLKKHLTNVPATDRVKLSDGLSLVPSTVQYPFVFPLPSDTKGHFEFCPPTKVRVVGSHLLGTGLSVNGTANVNISIEIPKVCLQDKDHLNYRYFHKRALYLSIVAGYLTKKKQIISSVNFGFDLSNPLVPVLVLTPKELHQYIIYIHTSISSESFPLRKLLPSKNNVRWGAMPHLLDSDSEASQAPPTPHYNSALLLEMESRERHLEELYAAALDCPALTEGTLLCKTWLHQRKLNQGYGGFTGFHSAMLLLYLLRQKKLNNFMSSYQVFRIFLQFIATSNWNEVGISIADRQIYPSLPSIEEFHSVFPVVFLDSTGYFNLTWSMSLLQYQTLRHEANLCHAYLNESDGNFSNVFLKPVSPLLKYDALLKLDLTSGDVRRSPLFKDGNWEGLVLDSGGWVWPHVLNKVVGVVTKALEGRVQLISQLPSSQLKWSYSEAPPPLTFGSHVTLGLIFDTEKAFNPLIMGPPADSSEARLFRSFWGERSELRRFSDGAINEAVLWEGQQKRAVPKLILEHVLARHANLSGVILTHTLLDKVLSNGARSDDLGAELSVGVVSAFTELSRQLRQLRELPLDVATVKGASLALCQTEVHPPVPWNGKLSSKLQSRPQAQSQDRCLYPSCRVATPPFIPCFHVVLHMEASGKWPDDPNAIDDIKTAFYLAISKSLHQQCGLVACPSKKHLDVLKDGYVFRLSILYPREVSLLNELKTTSSLDQAVTIERNMIARPLLVSTLTGLQSQFPVYSLGTRLCKKWVCSHLLTNHIPEEAIELLVAHLFIHPAPYTVPGSLVCVFLRFLKLIVSHDWLHEPLLVNLNNQFTDEIVSQITSSFTDKREQHPLMFIATPLDHTSKLTKHTPTTPILNRLLVLARGSLELLTNQIDSLQFGRETDFKQIFRTPLKDYNVLIYLDETKIARQQDSHTHSPMAAPRYLPVVQFDPVQLYVEALESAYANLAMFFYDKFGSHVIGLIWKPQVFEPRPYKVTDLQCFVTVSRNDSKLMVAPDKGALLDDMKMLGEDLVTKIEVLST